MFPDFPQYAAGIAHRHNVCRDIPGDDAARTDNRIVADAHTGKQNGSGADPHIIADMNRDVELRDLAAQFRIYRVAGSGDGYIGAKHNIIPDKNIGIVHQSEIKICIDMMAEMGGSPSWFISKKLRFLFFGMSREKSHTCL